ncbi:MAG: hypothetical protein SFX73_39440 [Kofleriaceae bacterium]|nr:hypothetical protein [Kofleriaceae bacterium]
MPCPQCGGFVHPIAGRCKHCKTDIAALRAARPAAAAALPALRQGIEAAPAPVPASPYAPHGSAPVAQPVAPPVFAVAIGADAARPILPPRPTGRMDATAPKRSLLRNWPVIVIVLASLAIATAVALMVIPPAGTAKADSRRLAPPPAPERMETNPLPPPSSNGNVVPPKSSGIDPWSKGNPNAQPVPPDDDADMLDPDDPSADPFANGGGNNGGTFDPFGSLGGNPLAQLGGLGMQDQFMFTVMGHVCSRAKSCGTTQLTPMCDVVDQLGGGKAPSCAAGQRCLAKIDQLDCDVLSLQNVLGASALAQDCMEAIQSC